MRRRLATGSALSAGLAFCVLLGMSSERVAPPARPYAVPLPSRIGLPATVVLYGDSRPASTLELWRDDPGTSIREVVLRAIAAERPVAVLHSGDLVFYGDSAYDWSRLDRELDVLREKSIPFLPALGNHEVTGRLPRALANYFARFTLLDGRWYEQRIGPVAFLVTDTNFGSLSTDERRRQEGWFLERLAATDRDESVRLVVVIGHHPAYTNALSHGPDEQVRRRFVQPALRHAKARFFLAGHVHAYERFVIDGRTFVTSGGGGAPLMSVRTGPDAAIPDAYAGARERSFHYLRATIESDRLRIDVVMLDRDAGTWSVVDGFSFDY
jgi:hypothetical protein